MSEVALLSETQPVAESAFRHLIERSADAVLVLRPDGEVCYANPAAEGLLGRPAGDLIGTPFGQPVSPGDLAELDVSRRAEDGSSELRIAEMRSGEITWASGPAVIATLRDVTQRRRDESSLRFLAEVGRELADTLDEAEILRVVLRQAQSRFGRSVIVHLESHGGVLTERSASLEPEVIRVDLTPGDARMRSWRHGETVSGTLADADAPARDSDRSRRFLCAPLVAGGRVVGVLTAVQGRCDPPLSADRIRLAEDFARRCAGALENARLFREIQEESRRKSEFLAMLGHELRNPLSAIRTALQVHRIDSPSSAGSVSLGVIDRQLSHITRLVDDLLEVSRITRGRIELRKATHDIGKLVAERAATSTPLIGDRGQRLSLRVPPEPAWVEADPVRVEQILCNLIHNAAKFSDRDSETEVAVSLTEAEVTLTVTDHGVGIRPELIPELFEPFHSGPQTLDRSAGGLGIGLTLVRGLAELHGGTVSAHSDGPGTGSRFVVRFPRAAAPQPVSAPERMPAGERKSRRLLLVEDNHDAREMLCQLLRSLGHRISAASDGQSGIEMALAERPEAAVIDIGLPGIDGYSVARAVREVERGEPGRPRTFLIALTGYGLPSDVEQAKGAGFDLHMVKPLDMPQLMGVLDRLQ